MHTRSCEHDSVNIGRDSPSRGLTPWIAHWEDIAPAPPISSTSSSPMRACVFWRNTSPHHWDPLLGVRTGQDSFASVLPRRANAVEENRGTFNREGFSHCMTIARHTGKTGLVDRASFRVPSFEDQRLFNPPSPWIRELVPRRP